MKTYNIYKKRDGQSFESWSEIYAENFDAAKKEFAKKMTNDNWEKSNNIVWLDKKEDGVKETGWYVLDGSVIVKKQDPEDKDYEINDYANSEMCLFCSEKSIQEGFSYWNEDVYTWIMKDNFKVLITDENGNETIEDEFSAIDEKEALEQAKEIYLEEDGYTYKLLKS